MINSFDVSESFKDETFSFLIIHRGLEATKFFFFSSIEMLKYIYINNWDVAVRDRQGVPLK